MSLSEDTVNRLLITSGQSLNYITKYMSQIYLSYEMIKYYDTVLYQYSMVLWCIDCLWHPLTALTDTKLCLVLRLQALILKSDFSYRAGNHDQNLSPHICQLMVILNNHPFTMPPFPLAGNLTLRWRLYIQKPDGPIREERWKPGRVLGGSNICKFIRHGLNF